MKQFGDWLDRKWPSILGLLLVFACGTTLIWGIIRKVGIESARLDTCISIGYAGVEYIGSIKRYVCYSILVEGEGTFVDLDTLRARTE